jgi:hypothetical protein
VASARFGAIKSIWSYWRRADFLMSADGCAEIFYHVRSRRRTGCTRLDRLKVSPISYEDEICVAVTWFSSVCNDSQLTLLQKFSSTMYQLHGLLALQLSLVTRAQRQIQHMLQYGTAPPVSRCYHSHSVFDSK